MKTLLKKAAGLWLCALALMLAVAWPLAVYASGSSQSSGEGHVGFRVSAVIPDNQIDSSLTYFDLRMSPQARQTLEIIVYNEEAHEITVETSTISASTNRNGLIDYRTPDIRDESLLHPFSEISGVQSPVTAIPAGGSAKVLVDIQMPGETFDGVILGGIVITRQDNTPSPQENAPQGGSVIYNNYSYIIGVKLTETDNAVAPAFELFKAAAETVSYRPAIVHYLRNSEAAIVKGMNVSITVTQAESGSTVLEDAWIIDMAPNSVIQLPSYTTMDVLRPGNYNSTLVLTHAGTGSNAITLNISFTIDGRQVEDIESTIPREGVSIPPWVWLIAAMLGLVGALVLVLIILLLKRRKKEKDEEAQEKTCRISEDENKQADEHSESKL